MNIAVYLGSNDGKNPAFKKITEELGAWIGDNGHNLVYGGADCGLMGILADTVQSHGGCVTGVIPGFMNGKRKADVNRCIVTETMSERKAAMIELADAFIAMPGGPGTLEEIAEVISLSRLARNEKECILYDYEGYWTPVREMFLKMIDNGFVSPSELNHVHFASDLDEIREILEEKMYS